MTFFAWEALLEAILTGDNLREQERGFTLIGALSAKEMKRVLTTCYCIVP